MNSTEPNQENPYGYTPTKAVCVIFLVLLGLTTIVHVVQAFYFKVWYWIPTTCLAGCGEVLGWSGRFWSTINVFNSDAYTIQIVSLIIAPTPFVAAIFTAFGRLVLLLGPEYSRITPRRYSRIFITLDILCLVIQALGGAQASSSNSATDSNAKIGGFIALGGIVLQMISLLFFILLACEFLIRYKYNRPVRTPQDTYRYVGGERRGTDPKIRIFIKGLAVATCLLVVRAIYRTVELADGWNGKVIHTQVLFNLFDATMVFLALFTMNLAHPGYWLRQRTPVSETERLPLDNFPFMPSHEAPMETETTLAKP
ncbi:RTA1-domain-containing protein [Obba rivulosa]|uniref:RTA1-domain-containing protein n=1 Tax=Obba rivulosa TaxID=1052685 RepID=A0A8E2DUB6_9APHY|nr:RTA1-domain-containing protein [Obba rivulosa]